MRVPSLYVRIFKWPWCSGWRCLPGKSEIRGSFPALAFRFQRNSVISPSTGGSPYPCSPYRPLGYERVCPDSPFHIQWDAICAFPCQGYIFVQHWNNDWPTFALQCPDFGSQSCFTVEICQARQVMRKYLSFTQCWYNVGPPSGTLTQQ